MKKIIILSIMIFFVSFTFSQKIEKAYKYLNNKDLEKAFSEFEKCVEKNTDIIPAKYGLALLYADDKFSKTNYSISYRYFQFVEKKLTKSNAQNFVQFGISPQSVEQNKKIVLGKAYKAIENDTSILGLTNFIAKYPDTEQAAKVKVKRNSMAFAKAKSENTIESYSYFLKTFIDAEQIPEAEKLHKKLWMDIYYSFAADGEISSLKIFESRYPDFPFAGEETKKYKRLAHKAQGMNLSQGYIKENDSTYRNYIKEAEGKLLSYTILQRLIEPLIKNKNFVGAYEIANEFSSYFSGDKRFEKLLSILNQPVSAIAAKSISSNINTDYALEYAATLTADGKKLYFCGQNRSDNMAPGNEDVFVSILDKGVWSFPQNIKSINTDSQHEAPLSISADGNTMLMYSASDIYFTNKTPEGWSKKKQIPVINTEKYWEADAMISADGNSVFFISDRVGNVGEYHAFSSFFNGSYSGNTDIYVSQKTETSWTQPVNLGKIINTPFSERSPFLHPDMKTLYFSSEGHGSLGKLDVFKTERLYDTSWIYWSEPVNLGISINSSEDEYDYRISTNGETAYFSYFLNTNADIYYFEIPSNIRPGTVTSITGKLTDKTGIKINGRIRWENLETGKTIGFADSDPESGDYIIVLPNGKNYGYFVDKQDYYPVSGNIDLTQISKNQDIKKNIEMISVSRMIETGEAISIKNLFFDFDKDDIKKESFPELDRLAGFIKSQVNLKIEISGHTDNKGSAAYNKTLSANRAASVKTYLLSKGCNSSNITSIGFGDTKPISTNDTEQGRAENRRVEFKIVK